MYCNMSILCLYLNNIFDGGNMSIDTNSMASVLIDTQINNIQQQQKQDAINYLVHELKVSLVNLLDEVERIEQKINRITNKKEAS